IRRSQCHGPARPRHGGRMSARLLLVSLSLLVLILGYLAWSAEDRQRLVSNLNAAERHVAYENTLHTYQTMCSGGQLSDAFQHYCDTQRDFLRLFPECDTGC